MALATLEEAGTGRLFLTDPSRRIDQLKLTLKGMGGYIRSDRTIDGSKWAFAETTPAEKLWLEKLVENLNNGSSIPRDEPVPRPNQKHVQVAEANGIVYVSGPVHIMIEHINKRLKSQGFEYDSSSRTWSTAARNLTPLKRKNLQKLVAPYTEGGGGDIRSKGDIIKEEMLNRRTKGWCLTIPFELKDKAKDLGGLWDDTFKTWCMPDQSSYDAVKVLADNVPAAVAKREIARRKQEKLCVVIPFELKDKARDLGGLWDADARAWCMPDETSKRSILEFKAEMEAAAAKVVAERHIKEERERAEKAEQARLERERKGIVIIYQEGRARGDHFPVGHVFRDRKSGKVLTVLDVKSQYYPEDGLSFGLSDDRGWMHTIYAGPPQPQDAATFETKETAARKLRELKLKASKRRDDIEKYVRQHGETPQLGHHPKGDHLCTTGEKSIPYGGGNWFVAEPDALWFVQNNGHDGDDWSINNIPGSVGWRIPKDQRLVDELKEIERVFELEYIQDDVEEEIYRLFRW